MDKGSDISRLLPDYFCICVLQNSRAVLAWLEFRSHEIFHGLADAPDTRIPLACRAEELHEFGSERGRVEQKPAFVENGNTRLSGLAARPRSDGIRNEHTHRRF